MSKAPTPLLGFNNNVRHRGRIFHIQTEDSGVKFPRIVTHLFADGGRIVKTTRTDYSQHLAKADMAVVVRGMMKEQHKAMFVALRAGDLDKLLENVCGPLEAVAAVVEAPESSTDPTAKNDLETARVVVGSLVSKPGEASNLPASIASAAQGTQPSATADAQAVADGLKPLRDSEESLARRLSNPNLRKPTSVTPPVAEAFDLDVASLDKNPPPPKSRTPVAPSVRPPRKSNPAARTSRPAGPPPRPGAASPPAGTGADATGSLGRPQTRLAAAPPSNARSIFGDGAISEQSLDEVILSYLAEDLEEPSK